MSTLRGLVGEPKGAVVVGSAQGIGHAVCERLLGLGMTDRLLMVDIDAATLADAAHDLGRVNPTVRIDTLVADVRDEALLDAALQKLGPIGLGAVVAGMAEHSPLRSMTEESLRRVIDINLVGAVLAARTMARHMAAGVGGSIVAVTSSAGREPHLDQANYAAAKAGLAQAMRILGLESAPDGVRVNCVAPGITATRLLRNLPHDGELADGDHDRYRNRIPRRRIATPDEIATVIALLLSEAMGHVYLQEIIVDGGETLGR
jgi:2,3-dihydro-2,3-dihydroxybenzoate dehydrogenase